MAGASPSAVSGGTGGSRQTAQRAATNVTQSTPYAITTEPVMAISAPPSSGPTVKPRFQVTCCRALAAGSRSRPMSRGMIAARAGLLTAKPADATATSR